MAGETRTSQASLEIGALTGYALRTTQAVITGTFTTAYRARVSQVSIAGSVYTSYKIRASQISIVAWVLRFGSSSIPPGLIIDTGPFVDPPAPTGCDCESEWSSADIVCPGWSGSALPSTLWTPPDCPGH